MTYTNGNGKHPHTNGYHKIIESLPPVAPGELAPHDLEAEEAVIGSLLIDQDAILRVMNIIKPSDFYIHRLGYIYGAIKALFDQNKPTNDHLLIAAQLTSAGKCLDDLGGIAGLLEPHSQRGTCRILRRDCSREVHPSPGYECGR
jgi:hypothetical protein